MRVPDTLVRHVFEPLWDLYEGSVRLKTLREMRASQFWPRERILALQSERLNRMVRHAAATSPFHRERFAAAGIDPASVHDIADLAALPLLTKDDVRNHLDAILSTAYAKGDLVPAKTGGSTGVSLHVFCDRQGIEQRNAAALRSDEWSGWRLGEAHGAVWGNPPVATTFKNHVRTTCKDRVVYLDTMRIDDAAIAAFVRDWHRMRPGLLFGHAHSLFILAEALQDTDHGLRPTGIVATSMMLMPHERKVIEAVFGRPVTNRYGCEEVSLIGCECEEHHGMHLNAEHNIVEFLRDDGTACAPGEDGRIVVTELINFGMPMIRYEVGDRGVPGDRTCACGRGLPLMEMVTGRTADYLRAADGFRVAGISIIENSLTRIPGLHQMQVIQDEPLALDVNVVPGAGYDEATAGELAAALRGMLGERMEIRLHVVERIRQEKSGKYRFTICNV